MKLRVISHTHWDREWFLPAVFTCEWLAPFFSSLAGLLSSDGEYRFVLDGQTILLEDARKTGALTPELERRLRHAAGAGRLSVGPYYQQPDWNLVSPEALIRNIEIGMRDAAEFCGGGKGRPMRIAWLMDNFGQISQCPQIHASFGIDTVFMWRGLALSPEDVRSEYLWGSPDGSVVQAVYLLDSYRNAMRLLPQTAGLSVDEQAELVEPRVASIAERIRPFSPTAMGLLMNGYDQEMEPEAVLPVLQALRGRGHDISQVTPEEYVAELKAALGDGHHGSEVTQPLVSGEQYNGRYICVFPGVLSARSYLKRENYAVETELEQYLEPLVSLAALVTQGYTPPEKTVEQLWRRLLRNHPHDSICGVSVDDVHTTMEFRFQRLRRELAQLQSEALGALCSSTEAGGWSVFNPLPYPRSGVVTVPNGELEQAVFVGNLPGLSLQPIAGGAAGDEGTVPEGVRPEGVMPVSADATRRCISNVLLTVRVAADGTLSLTSSSGQEFSGLLELEDGGDCGDTYTYAPPLHDRVIRGLDPERVRVELRDESPLRATLCVKAMVRLPVSLEPERGARASQLCNVPVHHELILEAGSPVLRVRTSIRNTARDHRLRFRFPVPPQMRRLRAGVPLDVVERPAAPEPAADLQAEISPELQRLMLGAREPEAIRTLPMRDFLSCSDPELSQGLAIYAPGLFEYELSDGAACVTALRAVAWLARPDVSTRTGDAGPLIATPDAQCLRDIMLEFALFPFAGKAQAARIPALAAELRAPLRVLPGTAGPAAAAGLLKLNSPGQGVVHSSLRMQAGRLLLRLYNPGEQELEARVRLNCAVRGTRVEHLDGRLIEEPAQDSDGCVTLAVPAHAVRTLAAEPDLSPAQTAALQSGLYPAAAVPAGGLLQLVQAGQREGAAPASAAARSFLQQVPLPPVLDRTLVDQEHSRCNELREQYHTAQTRLEQLTPGAGSGAPEYQRCRAEVSTAWRTLLEAEISAIMAERKLKQQSEQHVSGAASPEPYLPYEPYDDETHEALRRVGLKLNAARVRKRADDYAVAIAEGG